MSAPSRRGAAVRTSGVHRRLATDAGPVTVRVAGPDDLEVVLALRLALLREHHASPLYGRLRPDVEPRARLHFAQQLVHAEHEATLLAERDGAAIGCLRVSESRGSPLLLPARYGYLASAYVVPEARRAGVLRLLVGHALAWCRARGLVEVRLHADAMNDGAARAWEALGFTVVEQLRHRVLTD
jgi:ribosomal protein S18 acetylase RimI-like enzyme